MDSLTAFGLVLVIVIIFLAVLFRKQIVDLDRSLGERLKKSTAKKQESDVGMGLFETVLPSASYHIRTFCPNNDLTQDEKTFACAGRNLEEALQGVVYLKKISEQQKGEQKNKENYTGIG